MKIRPVILCGGAGTRLWPNEKNHQAKQFINFGGWTLIQKTLERVKNSIFDYPIISTNQKYLKQVRYHLKKNRINISLSKKNELINKFRSLTSLIILSFSILYPSTPQLEINKIK